MSYPHSTVISFDSEPHLMTHSKAGLIQFASGLSDLPYGRPALKQESILEISGGTATPITSYSSGLSRGHAISASTAEPINMQTVWLRATMQHMLAHASTLISDDEEFTELEHQLFDLIKATYKEGLSGTLLDTLKQSALTESPPRPMKRVLPIAHALTAVGKMRHPPTHSMRRNLLEDVLRNSGNAYLRSSAVLGLAYINDPSSLEVIGNAEARETDSAVKKQLRVVREQLEVTLSEQQSNALPA